MAGSSVRRSRSSGLAGRVKEFITAVSMTAGRGPAARAVADVAGLESGDQVLDIGCGPGTAVREAARRGVTATGIDPSAPMLRLARQISFARRSRNVAWRQGCAEALPVPDRSVTLVWALSSAHHWDDRAAALGEISRVLAPGGRLLIAERLRDPGAHGHAAHGLTHDQAVRLASQLSAAGFTDVLVDTRRSGRQTLLMVRGMVPAAAAARRRGASGADAQA